ncbi:hypothetical protein C900_04752 [Fulvivirga imtechensis AK7]|uniref:Tetratricopeptide repeat protein n=2 Tax=Fulvivirga TaxID=396811 RepID=L8JW44_9BACT|nr:hypothetical protein C900_04752 [Fulvivirga imtechensis AK7]
MFDNYEVGVKHRTDIIDGLKSGSPYKNFYLAEMYLQKAFVNLKFGNDWTAAWDFRQAYKLIRKNSDRQHASFIPNYKSMGLLHVMIGSVPERYQWIMSLLGMHGTVQQGIAEIQRVADSDGMFSQEAKVVHYLLQAYLLNESDTAVSNFNELFQLNDKNLLFGYLYMSLLIKNSQSETALDVFNDLMELDDNYLEFNFLNYLAGEIYLQKGDYPLAETYFHDFIKNSKGENFIKDAYYKLFLTYWISNEEDKAIRAHKKAQSAGKTISEADKHASKSLSQTEYPNKMIMKLRLLTDGGFYQQAEELLEQPFVLNSKKERVEFVYRKARLLHKSGKIKEAIGLYQETIDASGRENWYFAPNACLQLGYIYRAQNDTPWAKNYFNQVLSYKNHEYKTSLDNKAKAALEQL